MDQEESPQEMLPPGAHIVVFYTDQQEVQVGTNSELHPGEMRLMLEVAAKKLELLEFRMMMAQLASQRQGSGLVVARRNVGGIGL